MGDENSVPRMRNLFVTYHDLLRNHIVGWVTKENPKISGKDVTTEVRPEALRTLLQCHLSFGYKHLKSDFRALMSHCLRLRKAFQILYVSDARKTNGKQEPKKKKDDPAASSSSGKGAAEKARVKREPPVCLYLLHAYRGCRHLLKYCTECPESEKKELRERNFAHQQQKGPDANIRSQARDGNDGRLSKGHEGSNLQPDVPVLLADGSESVLAMGGAFMDWATPSSSRSWPSVPLLRESERCPEW